LPKTLVKVSGMYFENVGNAYIQRIKVSTVCVNCDYGRDVLLHMLDTRDSLLYFAGPCPRCKRECLIVFKYSLLHFENLVELGDFVQVNSEVTHLIASNFHLQCDACEAGNIIEGTIPGEQ
jgi:hypothetical protein